MFENGFDVFCNTLLYDMIALAADSRRGDVGFIPGFRTQLTALP